MPWVKAHYRRSRISRKTKGGCGCLGMGLLALLVFATCHQPNQDASNEAPAQVVKQAPHLAEATPLSMAIQKPLENSERKPEFTTSTTATRTIPLTIQTMRADELAAYKSWYNAAIYNQKAAAEAAAEKKDTEAQAAQVLYTNAAQNCQRILNGQYDQMQLQAAEDARSTIQLEVLGSAQLVDYYKQNEVAADADFKGKWCLIRGVAKEIARDLSNTPYVTFENPDDTFCKVQAMFLKGEGEKQLYNITPGTPICIAGKCDGKFGNVILRECKIMPVTGFGSKQQLKLNGSP